MGEPNQLAGHAFISYVREDSQRVDQLQRVLEAAGVPVWRDTADLWPGDDWRTKIRRAITENALVFIACFSRVSLGRIESYQNEELLLAIGQWRRRSPEIPWLIPVRFDDCVIPDRDLGGGSTLASIQRAGLFGDRYDEGAERLVAAILRILKRGFADAADSEGEPIYRRQKTAKGTVSGPHVDRLATSPATPSEPPVAPERPRPASIHVLSPAPASVARAAHDHAEHWAALTGVGYVLTSDHAIGLSGRFRQEFQGTYFNDRVLRHDDGNWPTGRKRARDVIEYQWGDGSLQLREHERIIITDRAGIPGVRNYSRVTILDDPLGEELVRTFLSLVPPGRRQGKGTFGVNLFRTFTDVATAEPRQATLGVNLFLMHPNLVKARRRPDYVAAPGQRRRLLKAADGTAPHHDGEEFVMIYVLDRIGDGAESYLYHPDGVTDTGQPVAEPVLRRQLKPGDVLIFEDKRFMHGATPLGPLPDGTALRDVLICTVDYPSTYFGATVVG